MRLTLILAGAVSLATTLAPQAVFAEDVREPATTREIVDADLQDLKTQLHLSDYTWEQVRVILKSGIRERIAIARKYGIQTDGGGYDQLSSKEQRRLKGELKDSRKTTVDRMERFLDKDQMKAFKSVQEEVHEAFLREMRQREGSELTAR